MDFLTFASVHGLIINHLPLGRITRCATRSKRGSKNGAFYFDGDWGWIQDWAQSDQIEVWKSDKVIDDAQFKAKVRASREKYDQEKAVSNAEAAHKAEWILSQCTLEQSAYLAKKGFPDMHANVWFRHDKPCLLVVPMRKDNVLIGCQLINPDGEKKFLKGQITQDAAFQIGSGKLAFFVEGYASGLSLKRILEALKVSYRIYITFSAGNLVRFAKRINGYVIADNDTSGTGEKAAIESGKPYFMPSIQGFDINDYELECGLFRASQDIKKLIFSKL